MNVTGPAVFSLRSITGFHNATTATTYSLLGEDLPQSAAIEMRSDLGMPVDVVFGNSDALSQQYRCALPPEHSGLPSAATPSY
jgi:hypothetical protein